MKRRRTRARDFGDNPRIRGGLDRSSFNVLEPYERHHRGVKKSSTRVRSHIRKGRRVKSHIRRM